MPCNHVQHSDRACRQACQLSWHCRARITIALVARNQEYGKVLIGLDDALPHLRGGIDDSLPGRCTSVAAFVDASDTKWRGPPATLWHMSRYVDIIINFVPRYDVLDILFRPKSSPLAFNITHFIALCRKTQIPKIKSHVHDPSSISVLLRFLLEEDGMLWHKYPIMIIRFGFAVILGGVLLLLSGSGLRFLLILGWVFVLLIWIVTVAPIHAFAARAQATEIQTLIRIFGESPLALSQFHELMIVQTMMQS